MMANPTYGEFKFPGTFGFSGSDGKQMVRGYARGGAKKKTMAKVGKVMQEFAEGELHSGSKTGPVVRNPKQALAIGYSEARKKPMKKQMGGPVARDPQEAEVKAAQMQMAAQEQARQIRGETERQLREGSADRARERVMADMEKRGAVARRKDGGMTKALEKHADLPASKAHKGLKYGGKAVPTHKSTPKIS
jgi:hypothetical protein